MVDFVEILFIPILEFFIYFSPILNNFVLNVLVCCFMLMKHSLSWIHVKRCIVNKFAETVIWQCCNSALLD